MGVRLLAALRESVVQLSVLMLPARSLASVMSAALSLLLAPAPASPNRMAVLFALAAPIMPKQVTVVPLVGTDPRSMSLGPTL